MTSTNTIKLFNKFSNNLIKDFIGHLESNDIQIPDEILQTFLVDKPSKRKGRLSPYTVFMKEYRSTYQKENPQMSFREVSQAIAVQWKVIKETPQKFKEYEDKANQYNSEIPNKTKKLCKATKGSDKQPCRAEAKNGDYCGRHKKLAFDQVDMEEIIHSDSDYLSCQTDNCSRHADSGPFCSFHSKPDKKTCIKEKANGQTCGKPVKKGDFCGFHNPDKVKKNRKTKKDNREQPTGDGALPMDEVVDIIQESLSIAEVAEQVSEISSGQSTESSDDDSIQQQTMYYDEEMNVHTSNDPSNDKLTKFIIYNNDPMGYDDNGEEIGIVKDNKMNLFK